jgi:putative ABC transport system substrate-binding protein
MCSLQSQLLGWHMRRRDFITLLGGAAAGWPLVAHAQSLRRIGILSTNAENATESKEHISAFKLALAQLGWVENRSIRIDMRFASGNASSLPTLAGELLASAPEVILADALSALTAAYEASRTIPIVFVNTVDPVAAGLVSSVARPDTNITGFTSVEPATSGKWLELLKEAAPNLSAVLILFSSATPASALRLPAIDAAAHSTNVRLTKADVRSDVDIEQAIDAFASERNGGIIVLPSPITQARRDVIIARASKQRIPAVYSDRVYVESGGLMSYAADVADQWRQAAGYIDRFLKGRQAGRPADPAADQISTRDQSQGGQIDRAGIAVVFAAARRRSDRIRPALCCSA